MTFSKKITKFLTRSIKQGGLKLNTMYFLSAIFETKYGKAPKYYDDKGFHWMLAFDKPILFKTKEEAIEKAKTIFINDPDLASDIFVKDIAVYEDVWEHKLSEEELNHFSNENGLPENVLFEFSHGKYFIFLSHKKQVDKANHLDGLYRVDRANDVWIYGIDKLTNLFPETVSEEGGIGMSPKDLLKQAYEKMEEAKALMTLEDYPKEEITKVESVMVFLSRLIK